MPLQHVQVDWDPQCDLTRFFLRMKLETEHDGDYQAMTSRANCTGGVAGTNCRTIFEAMGKFLINHNHPEYDIEPYQIHPPHGANIAGKIYLVAGHEDAVDLEKKIGNVEANPLETVIETLSYPSKLMKETAIRYDCSIVLMDSNPFSGSLNGNLFHSSDYFFIPCGPDNASKHGIRALTDLILKPATGWLTRRNRNLANFVLKNEDLAASDQPLLRSAYPDKVSSLPPFPTHPTPAPQFALYVHHVSLMHIHTSTYMHPQTPKFLGIVIGNYTALKLDNNNFVQGLANDRPSKAFYPVMTAQRDEALRAMDRLRTHPALNGASLSKSGLSIECAPTLCCIYLLAPSSPPRPPPRQPSTAGSSVSRP